MAENEKTTPWRPDSDDEASSVLENISTKSAPDGPPCLVVFYGENIGRRYSLEQPEFVIGRAAGTDLRIDHTSVSRQHAKFVRVQDRVRVADLGSTNGLLVNDEQTREVELCDGDLIQIGTHIFKYLSPLNSEAKYREEVHRLTTIDGLTQAYNKRFFEATIEREVNQALRHGHALSLVMFDVDHFKEVNDSYGHVAGDGILRTMAHLIAKNLRREDALARYGGDEFAIIFPDLEGKGVMKVSEKLRGLVEHHEFRFNGERIPVSISLGVTEVPAETEEKLAWTRVVERADQALYSAKEAGGNRVELWHQAVGLDGERTTPGFVVQRALEAETLLRKVLGADQPGPLIAFELANERDVLEHLGRDGWDGWLRELRETVRINMAHIDTYGVWRDRYVLLALAKGGGDEAEHKEREIRAAWEERAVPVETRDVLQRVLRSAHVLPDELTEHGERALDVVVTRLLEAQPVEGQAESLDALPFPLAAPIRLIDTQTTSSLRVRAILNGIETYSQFLVCVSLSEIRAHGDAETLGRLGKLLGRLKGHISMGRWVELAFELTAVAMTCSAGSPVFQQGIRGIGVDSKPRAKLRARLFEAVAFRNEKIAHPRQQITEAQCEAAEPELRAALETFLECLSPFAELDLIRVTSIEDTPEEDDPDGGYVYEIRHLRGSSESHFVVETRSSPSLLKVGRCYLTSAESRPLPLAPWIVAMPCPECQRMEVFMPPELVVGPEGTTVKVLGVLSNHEARVSIPWTKRARALYGAVAG